ncbi:hypothetical protein RRG08_030724 [Elysia crispata]|uniref:Uncharacterized protein n=1 Tax=Elysia crispata TaxID=231223 RepID=A0AAE0Y496_9GAST|nr:hypothetical protein RRG08_030724 [Elysia crispata]
MRVGDRACSLKTIFEQNIRRRAARPRCNHGHKQHKSISWTNLPPSPNLALSVISHKLTCKAIRLHQNRNSGAGGRRAKPGLDLRQKEKET